MAKKKNVPTINFDIKQDNKKSAIFETTDPSKNIHDEIQQISSNDLEPFKNHPFKLYSGDKMDEMVESIKNNGILTPFYQ